MTGFSWGGETAAEMCRRDTRVDVAVLLDPAGVTTAAHSLGIGKPFTQISTGDLILFSLAKHDAIGFQISDAVHSSFDGYYWYWSLDSPATSRTEERCILTVRAYMLSFLDKY